MSDKAQKVVKMTEETQCPDCETINAIPRFEQHKQDQIKCGACGALYWHSERIACICGASRYMILGHLADSGGLVMACLGCGHVSDSRNIEEFLHEVPDDIGE